MAERIQDIRVAAYTIPTDAPESDGTLEWNSTTLVVVEVQAAGTTGLGYTYADAAAALLIRKRLAEVVRGLDPMDSPRIWQAMRVATRNLGHSGLVATAISAVDCAVWDLKARLLNLPLAKLLGQVRDAIPIYGSGGFTSYSIGRLQEQLGGWAVQGLRFVKMKIGRDPDADLNRVRAAREAIGPDTQLFVDANGGYSRKQALNKAEQFVEFGVTWFEEPVSSDDLDGLRLLRDRAPAQIDIAAGEYGYELFDFRGLLDAGAVDVLQADITRCGGVTGMLAVDALCQSHCLPLSAHTAPALHVAVCCASPMMRHLEYFHDHVRIENLLFDGVPQPTDGTLRPDLSRVGNGLEFKHTDAKRYFVE